MALAAVTFAALLLGLPNMPVETGLAPKKEPSSKHGKPEVEKDGPDGWLESPPAPPTPPPVPPRRPGGCDMNDLFCKNETKAEEQPKQRLDKAMVQDDAHHPLKKMKKRQKALEKMKEAKQRIEQNREAKKKLKKRVKARDKMKDAVTRKDDALAKKYADKDAKFQEAEATKKLDETKAKHPTSVQQQGRRAR